MNYEIAHLLYDYLIELGISQSLARYLNLAGLLLATLFLIGLFDFIIKKVIRRSSAVLARRTKTNLDDIAITNKLPRLLAHVLPLLLAIELIPVVFSDFAYLGGMALKFANILAIILILNIAKSILRSLRDYLKTQPRFQDKPIDSYIQVFMIIGWIMAIMTIFAIITDTSIWKFFTALGAASAILLLLFKDSILGLVASIQVSMNDMVRIGDWITFEKYGADGDVIEINLATVKIQNFDKTITTIPTYALITDSFKNWRGMQESGGRRIKRALIIKQKSIKFLTDPEIEKLKKIHLLSDYLNTRNAKIGMYNKEHTIDKTLLLNGQNLTNIGVFRKYISTYLEKHSALNNNMIMMTRQLAPTPQGIPIEIYVFSSDKRWQNYEYIMADIFDHLLAAVSYFDLEVFELPTSLEMHNVQNNPTTV
ncbi:mechanosensitive ion channel domain-containing protein [uncultured Eudoraea sp.]|uniref:mechanosensitive ion channel family protein n=1 Tax=uncultured Eudoraea sp. TaxID=1035614 RepID=UPI0026279568|nr:mechanosensitive ion channel domain-containing protein [uncultured Eudoraea sp.]